MEAENLKSRLPWWLKIISKIVLSRLPITFERWRELDLFRHGAMNRGDYAMDVFNYHVGLMAAGESLSGCTLLELGPGDGITSGLLAHTQGAERIFLVDAGDYAERDILVYQNMLRALPSQSPRNADLLACKSFDELCAASGTQYLTAGLQSLKTIPSHSVDFIISQAVLEHVRLAEFVETMSELWRILKPGGINSHRVDIKDHLGGALNNLRFSEHTWEAAWFSEAGFYTNRIRFKEMLEIFEQVGFSVEIKEKREWDKLPTPRRKMWAGFKELSDEDLLVSGFTVVLRPKPQTG